MNKISNSRKTGFGSRTGVQAVDLKVLLFLCTFKEENGYSPSHRELMDKFPHFTSTSVVAYKLKVYDRAGLLTRVPGIARSLRVTQKGMEQCGFKKGKPTVIPRLTASALGQTIQG